MKPILLTLLMAATPAHAGAAVAGSEPHGAVDDLFSLFMQVCVDNLHQTSQARRILEVSGWSEEPLSDFNDHGLFSNVLIHALQDDKGAFYLSPDGSHGFVFGPADNDLYPNAKCMLATTGSEAEPFVDWAAKRFAGEEHSDQTGRRFGNRLRDWQTRAFPDNLPAGPAIAAVSVASGLRSARTTLADTQVSVTGRAP